jgi:hypothetical protein
VPAELARWTKSTNIKRTYRNCNTWKKQKLLNKKKQQKKHGFLKLDNVRDFAWGSSRKFVWDAMPSIDEGKKIMCMSAYPKEAYNLYRKYSTKVVAHTLKHIQNLLSNILTLLLKVLKQQTEWSTL